MVGLAPPVGVVNLASPVSVVGSGLTSWCGESGPTSWCGESGPTSWCGGFGVVNLGLPAGLVDRTAVKFARTEKREIRRQTTNSTYENLSFNSENGHDRNLLQLLCNMTQFVPKQTVKQWKLSKSFNMCKGSDHDHSQN